MKSMMILVFLTALSGCAATGYVEDRLSKVVDTYCQSPVESRTAVRDEVNRAVDPNRIRIECDGK